METIIKQSADEIVLIGDNKLARTQGKVFINNHEITDIDTFFKAAEENTRLLEQVKKQKEFIEWLEDEIQQQETLMAENQEKLYFLMYEDEKEDLKLSSRKAYTRRIILEEVLQKYRSIIGGKHE